MSELYSVIITVGRCIGVVGNLARNFSIFLKSFIVVRLGGSWNSIAFLFSFFGITTII
jgi:hypothetical protein